MQIYKQEKVDGLEEIISSKASICFASLAEPSAPQLSTQMRNIKSIASIEDKDLYYVQSILVTSSWNKNDDIFDKYEIWVAKDTPSHKPTNLEHNEHDIIGHITANWPMTEEGVLINDNTPIDNLPDKYHILTGSVIYRGYSDPALRERSDKLIAEIESGQKYVSMECYFSGFDYGVLNKSTGMYKVLARNEDTAYLTKYLRAYGGLGEHENYKIGRVLRNITFSGKGFVNKPANPESVIFTHDNMKNFILASTDKKNNTEKTTDFEKEGVFSNQANLKENNMSLETENTTEANTEAQAPLSALEAKVAQLETALVEAQNTIATLESEKSESAKKMKDAEDSKEEENKTLKAALEAANETIAAYKTKEEEMMKKEKKTKRMAALVDNGVSNEIAEATVDKFENLDDASFEAVTSLLAAKKSKSEDKEEEMDDKEETKEEASTKVDASVLENVEVEKEIDLSVGGNANIEVESTRAALVDFVYNRLGKKLNKGE